MELLNNADAWARGSFDVTATGPADSARIAGSIQVQEAHFYRLFWLAPAVADDSRLSLPAPFRRSGGDAGILEHLLPMTALRRGPLARCELDLALGFDAPVPIEVAGATRGALRPELFLEGTGAEPRLVGKLAFGRNRPGSAVASGPGRVLLPLEEGVIYFDPAGLAESTLLLANFASSPGNGASAAAPGSFVFAPIDRVPVWLPAPESGRFDETPAGDEPSVRLQDFATSRADLPPDAAGAEATLDLTTAPPPPLFPETDAATGRRLQYFRLEIR